MFSAEDRTTILDEGQALCADLRAGDMTEARLRARRMAGIAALLGRREVQLGAMAVVGALGREGELPAGNYAGAVLALAKALSDLSTVASV